MGDIKGFLKFKRQITEYRPVCERIKDFCEVCTLPVQEHSQQQASRCMDCGTPFCHWGCPIGNYIPEWNDFLFQGSWQKAAEMLLATNNLPEITGRVCPAPCEYSCVLGINDDPVAIRENELAIIEYAFKNNFIKPRPSKKHSGKCVAVVGSGPSALALSDQLNKAGHKVFVFEKDKKPGGILRYGIPDFKLEKWVLNRRIGVLEKEGIEFLCGVDIGRDLSVPRLRRDFDAVCLAGGSRTPRDLNIEGRDLKGIHFAMDYLVQANKRLSAEDVSSCEVIDAKDKKVVVLGGGDTGSDCVGLAHRQGAKCVIQIELLPQPPECRSEEYPWPRYPLILKTSSSHEEGGRRNWSILTKKFIGENGRVTKLFCVGVDFRKDGGSCPFMKEIAASEFEIETDLVILALGFLYPQKEGLIKKLSVELDSSGNVKTDEFYMTSVNKVFSCGDMRRGQSLIVWAISEGRTCAYHMDEYLMGESNLPKI